MDTLVCRKINDSIPKLVRGEIKMSKRIMTLLVMLILVSMMLFALPRAKANPHFQFALASWSYPDDYGQGIHTWYAQSNRTGSWVTIEAKNYLQDETPIEWNVSQAIRMLVTASMNRTLLGLNDTDIGKRYIQHDVTVTDQFGSTVFSQQNFTFNYVLVDVDIYWYQYYVILDFLPLEAEFYTVTINCEIYW